MSKLKRILRLSPYEVHFHPCGKGAYANGLFMVGHCQRIIINNDATKTEQLIAIVHEIGHAKCYENNCECFVNDNTMLKEYHALMFTLKYFLENKDKELLEKALYDADSWKKKLSCHKKVMLKMILTPLFDECCKFILGDKKYFNMTKKVKKEVVSKTINSL